MLARSCLEISFTRYSFTNKIFIALTVSWVACLKISQSVFLSRQPKMIPMGENVEK
jgi:hypothetical protein